MPSPEFYQDYRHDLATQLFSTSNRQERRQILTEAQGALDYQLAKHERIAFQQGVDFKSEQIQEQQQYQETTDKHDGCFMSNEEYLYKLYPTIKDKTGTIVAVGSDQGLDLFVNSQAQYVLMIDICSATSPFTRTLLELGSIHKKIFGEYPNIKQYHDYFKRENLHHITRLLKDSFNNENLDNIEKILTQIYYGSDEPQHPLYYHYLKYKSGLRDNNGNTFSWNSSDENLRKVFEAYDEGRIFVLNRDLYTKETAEIVSKIVKSQTSSLDILYLSNSMGLNDNNPINILEMPLTENSIVLMTDSINSDRIDNFDFDRIDNIIFCPWHYTAISYKQYRKKIIGRDYTLLFDIVRDKLVSYSPEEGVTFTGIQI